MPTGAKHYCPSPRCPVLLPAGVDRCPAHARQDWRSDQTPARVRGRKLQRYRESLFDKEPLCRACRLKGRVTVATIRDHIIPLAEGGPDTEDNTQPLCQNCSDTKTQQEAQRGRARARQGG